MRTSIKKKWKLWRDSGKQSSSQRRSVWSFDVIQSKISKYIIWSYINYTKFSIYSLVGSQSFNLVFSCCSGYISDSITEFYINPNQDSIEEILVALLYIPKIFDPKSGLTHEANAISVHRYLSPKIVDFRIEKFPFYMSTARDIIFSTIT